MKSYNKNNRINQFRVFKNGLIRKFTDINSCLSALCGIQSQILSASYISLFNRVKDIDLDTINKAFVLDRSFVRVWGYRSTLHIVNATDWSLVVSAIKEDTSWFKNKIKKSNLENESLTISKDILNFSINKKYFSRLDLSECFESLDKYNFYISSWGGLLIDLSQKGFICHAPINPKINFSHRDNWLLNLTTTELNTFQANVILLRHFINSYAPIEIADFAFWRGISKTEAAKYFDSISNELVQFDENNRKYYIKKEDNYLYENFELDSKSVLLLYRFDPLLLAYQNKSNIIDLSNYKKIWRTAGHIEGVILESGFIIGHWNYKKMKNEIIFMFIFFDKISDYIISLVIEKGSEIANFLGQPNMKYKIAFEVR
jgi:hypothetical protein